MAPATTADDVSETAADEAPVASTQPHAPVMPTLQAPETDATDATDTADNQSDIIPEAPKADTEEQTDGKWSIAGITGHRVDPNDPTRLQLRISWDPSDGREWPQTWEPESTIQEDAFEIWGAYIMKHDCRQVLGEKRNKWHLLRILSHHLEHQKVFFTVEWEGHVKSSQLSEASARYRNPVLVREYWAAAGGRAATLGSV